MGASAHQMDCAHLAPSPLASTSLARLASHSSPGFGIGSPKPSTSFASQGSVETLQSTSMRRPPPSPAASQSPSSHRPPAAAVPPPSQPESVAIEEQGGDVIEQGHLEQSMTVSVAHKICPHCYVLVDKRSFKRHLLRHGEPLQLQCDLCGLKQSRYDALLRHKRVCPR